MPGGHGAMATIETLTVEPAGAARPRSCTTSPTTVAVPAGVGVPVDTIVNPSGTVRLAEPSCWVPVSFVSVATNVWVDPADTLCAVTSTAYGLVVVSANARGTSIPSKASARARGGRNRRALMGRVRCMLFPPIASWTAGSRIAVGGHPRPGARPARESIDPAGGDRQL